MLGVDQRVTTGVFQRNMGLDGLILQAEAELSVAMDIHALETGSNDKVWGYFPRYADQQVVGHYPLPRSMALMMAMSSLVHEVEGFEHVKPDFVRLCEGQYTSEGLHTDANDKGAILYDPEKGGREVLKMIINLHQSEPREFNYVDANVRDIFPDWPADDYSSVPYSDLPEGVEVETIMLPPRNGEELHFLGFLANSVLHSGSDGPGGHFLASYAGYVN